MKSKMPSNNLNQTVKVKVQFVRLNCIQPCAAFVCRIERKCQN